MNPQKVTAIIASNYDKIGAYFAWSQTTQLRSLLVDYKLCPPDTDMMGKWVEMTIDQRDRAQGPVKIVPDAFETRVKWGVVEVRVKFQHNGRYKDKFEMFYNDDFGFICDPRMVLTNVEQGAWYEGWLARHKEEGVKTRWRISNGQEELKPICDMAMFERKDTHVEVPSSELCVVTALVRSYRSNDGSYFAYSRLRPRSTIVIESFFCNRQSDLLGRWVEVSIDGRNRVQRPLILLNDVLETRVRGRSVQVFAEFQHIPNSVQHSNNQNEMFRSDYFGTIRDDMYVIENVKKHGWYRGWVEYDQPNEFEPRWHVASNQIVDECENRRDERNRVNCRSDETSEYSSRSSTRGSDFGHNSHYDNQPYQPHNRRRSRSSERRYDLEFRCLSPKPSNNERRRRSFSPDRYPNARNKPVEEKTADDIQRNSRELADPNISFPPTDPIVSQKRQQKTKTEEKLSELEVKFERASEIVAFFNSNKAINKALRLMDIEQYDELLELTEMK